jgi:membrane-associated protein
VNDLAAILLTWLVEYSYPIVGLTVLVAAIGVPLPTTVLVLAAGAMAADGDPSPYGLIAVIVLAAVVGDALSYAIARVGGGAALDRWGPRMGLTAERIAPMERRFERWGGLLVVGTRCVLTGLALPTNLVAGAARYPLPAFLGYALLGEIIWAGGLTGLGWWYGTNWVALLEYLNDAFTALTALAVAAVLAIVLVRLLRSNST